MKLFLYVLILVILASLTGIFLYYRSLSQPKPSPSGNSKASLTLGKIRHAATRNGIRQWSLEAASAEYFREEDRADFRDIAVVFFAKDGKNALLTAEKGVLNTKTNDMAVSTNVVVTKEGYRLETEKLHYSHQNKVIYSHTPVSLFQDNATITADSMTINLNNDTIKLKGNVKGNFSESTGLY